MVIGLGLGSAVCIANLDTAEHVASHVYSIVLIKMVNGLLSLQCCSLCIWKGTWFVEHFASEVTKYLGESPAP